MAKHKRCTHCDFNLVTRFGDWEHKLGGGHCDKPEPKVNTHEGLEEHEKNCDFCKGMKGLKV